MCNKMSDVRLSNASPTLERVDPRQPDNVRPPVRRNLFGRPDPGEVRRNVAALVQEGRQAFIETYNFDPVEERPLSPGSYEWEEDADAPEFFRRPPHGNQRPQRDFDDNGQDAAERSGRQSGRQRETNASRKRGAGALGPCSSDSQNKRSRTDGGDDDDDENQSDGAGSQAVTAAEERPTRPEGSAEVR